MPITSGPMAIAEQADTPLLTCEAVLAEAAFHLRDAGVVLAMVQEELVALSFAAEDHLRSSPHWPGALQTASRISPISAWSG